MLTDKEVKDFFFELEKNDKIFQFKVGDFSIYYLLRFWIEMDYRMVHFDNTKTNNNNIFLKLYSYIQIRLLKFRNHVDLNSKYFDSPNEIMESPLLFVSSSTYINREGFGSHLLDIAKYYFAKNIPINFVQRNIPDAQIFPKKASFYTTYLPLNSNNTSTLPMDVYTNLKSLLALLSEKTAFDYTKRIRDYYSSLITYWNEAQQLVSYIIQSKARYVFTYSAYTEPSIALACRQTGIKLIEVQHGVITPDTIYFQSSKPIVAIGKGLLLMPDYIVTLGYQWQQILKDQNSFFSIKNILNLGSFNYHGLKNFETSIMRSQVKQIRIIFFLQGKILGISDFLYGFIELYGTLLKAANIQIILRSHPNDQEEGKNLAQKFGNYLTIVDPVKFNSIESIVHSDIIFSATSMCLYEALALGKVVVSLNKYKGMTIPEGIKFVDTPAELWDFIQEVKAGGYKQEAIPYLSPFDTKVLDYFLEEGRVTKG